MDISRSERSLDSYGKLHKKELKSKLLYKNQPVISLSRREAEAVYKLAASLSNYENDDSRIAKLMNFKIKEDKNSYVKLNVS